MPGRGSIVTRTASSTSPKLCFFDLETTGLAGGAGTQAFLVGCAVIEDGGIRVRQFLLPGFEHERALLAMVAEWTSAQGTLVSFNGRTFDVPLIETRYLLHRFAYPLAAMPHLDMLHPARRLWKQRPGDRRPAARRRQLHARRCSSGISAAITASAMSRASRSRRATSASCATAMRIRSKRCSSTTASISSRWRW